MNKIWNITNKDLSLLVQDKAALIFMLLAPFLITLGMGAVTGAFSRGSTASIAEIPVVVVNLDEGDFGQRVVDAFGSESSGDLFLLSEAADAATSRLEVENDRVAAVVIIPPGFSNNLLLAAPGVNTAATSSPDRVEIYQNPIRPISSGLIQSVVVEVVNQLEINIAAQMSGGQGASFPQISIQAPEEETPTSEQVSVLAYLAPSMAIFFLMYTATQGGRSILAEREMGTLPRMLASPTRITEVLGGKVLSTFVAGFMQVSVLVMVAGLLFRLDWGHPLGVILLVAAASAGATGWGILLAAVAKSTYQVSSIGSALMLLFGILGGSFIPTSNFSDAMRWFSKLTPNAWAVDGFSALAEGRGMHGLVEPISVLLLMSAVLFTLAVLLSRRGWVKSLGK
jgi:ABC-2 type transport system permease protein